MPLLDGSTQGVVPADEGQNQQLDDALTVKLNELFYHPVKRGTLMIPAGNDPRSGVEKEFSLPVGMDQGDELIAAPPHTAAPLLGRQFLAVHRVVVFIKEQA